MPQKRNPAPLAGGNRAGVLQAEHAVDTREILRNQAQRRLRRQRLIARLHDLGPRAVFEAIDEIDRHRAFGDDLDSRLQRYADADPELLRAFGADGFPPSPTRAIGGWR
jgi:hypothetical protein